MPNPVTEFYKALTERVDQSLAARGDDAKIVIQVGSATCENAAGAVDVMDEFAKHIQSSGREDIVIHRTGCTGRCSKEPIVGVNVPGKMPVKYERVNRDMVHKIFTSHVQKGLPLAEQILDGSIDPDQQVEFLFCEGKRCSVGAKINFREVFQRKLQEAGVATDKVRITSASCFGACQGECGERAHILVRPFRILYRVTSESDLDELIQKQVLKGEKVPALMVTDKPIYQEFFDLYGDVSFFNLQSRVAMRNSGILDPDSLDEYVKFDGFKALATSLSKSDPDWVINEVLKAKLRGRGGGGFLTGKKWQMASQQPDKTRYIICNGDEGDPGAFMDRGMLESDPFSILEGMMIGAYAIGACKGFYYIRAEYPLAIKRIQNAIEKCREVGILGDKVMGSDWSFDLEIRLGAGAFVCGEETALIRSIEGERGQPKVRPPYPVVRGLWGKPTSIN
ncbi:MAG: NADH-quinone oxidoreductase subunit E, partial [Holophaga sp.]|nr:NADH-quinone oxidoreductase subunit E [Holophaga sp.]